VDAYLDEVVAYLDEVVAYPDEVDAYPDEVDAYPDEVDAYLDQVDASVEEGHASPDGVVVDLDRTSLVPLARVLVEAAQSLFSATGASRAWHIWAHWTSVLREHQVMSAGNQEAQIGRRAHHVRPEAEVAQALHWRSGTEA